MLLNTANINAVVKEEFLDYKAIKERGWEWFHFSGFQQDILGYKNKETGEEFPPTFNYSTSLEGMRRDEKFFFVRVTVLKDEMEQENIEALMAILDEDIKNGIEFLDSFLNCKCN